ncbi:hypothetical protein ACEWY4_004345 [Coilia grayii]|uniref:SCAN box domain-containing protein n=1 Tax=Coilia grayii TaxID=363190 RepID=A0ABD1KLS9_9TELE
MSVQEGETVRELQSRLMDLYQEWMCPSSKVKKEIGDTIVLKQFVCMLNSELLVGHNPQIRPVSSGGRFLALWLTRLLGLASCALVDEARTCCDSEL